MTSPELAQTREQLGLDAHSRVLLVSTEGDIDPQQYLDIVWGGQYLASTNNSLIKRYNGETHVICKPH